MITYCCDTFVEARIYFKKSYVFPKKNISNKKEYIFLWKNILTFLLRELEDVVNRFYYIK